MSWLADLLGGLAATLGLAAAPAVTTAPGYVEGEYLRIAPPTGGVLDTLSVARGDRIAAGRPLFAVDRTAARAERDRLAAALAQARAQLADLRTGRRPEELAVIAAQRARAEAALRYSEAELRRQEALARRAVASADALDAARSANERDRALLAEAIAQWTVGTLPARPEQIHAAEESVRMAEAALAEQERRLADLAPLAPADALVEDTLFNPGEWVPAGVPVVSLLPPGRVKIVAFVPEPAMNRLHPGDRLPVRCDGCPPDLTARVRYVSPRAEYTPPVIYSVGTRAKLVFRVEAAPDTPLAVNPGLPVELELP